MNEMSLCGFCGCRIERSCLCCPQCGSVHRDSVHIGPVSIDAVERRLSRLNAHVNLLEAELDQLLTTAF